MLPGQNISLQQSCLVRVLEKITSSRVYHHQECAHGARQSSIACPVVNKRSNIEARIGAEVSVSGLKAENDSA